MKLKNSDIEIRTTKDGYGTEVVVDGEPLDMNTIVALTLSVRAGYPTTLTVEELHVGAVKVSGTARIVHEDSA